MRWLNSEWLGGFISGVIATVIGFGLTMLWDIFKEHRGEERERLTLLRGVKQDIGDNAVICARNQQILQQELEVLGERKAVVVPLSPLKSGMWDVLKLRLPASSEAELKLLQQIRDYTSLLDQINEAIRSRENYRLGNEAMSNFHERLRLYDEALLTAHAQLITLLQTVNATLSVQIGQQ